jgi:hypothetical protein
MTKYLRCFKSCRDITAGKRYEIIGEDDGDYMFIDDVGDEHSWPIEPGEEGESYRDHFVLETDEETKANITVLPDESLSGIEREYCEVKRKAVTGERIKITAGRDAFFGQDFRGTIHEVTGTDGYNVKTTGKWRDGSTLNPAHDDYVVLESTAAVYVDDSDGVGRKYRMVDRKAAVGERVIMTEATGTRWEGARHVPDYHNGDIFEIARVNDGAELATSTSGKLFYHREYHVLEPLTTAPLLSEQSAQDQAAATISALALRLDALEETVRRMGTDLRVAQEDIDIMDESVAYDVRKLEAEVATLKEAATTYLKTQPTTPAEVIASLKRHRTTQQNIKAARQQRRDDIVERAKADVKRLVREVGGHGWETSDIPAFEDHGPLTIRFVVSRDKRTVAALAEWACFPGDVCERGTAKCAPNDVFNAHIGKAISLRRALSLEVPADYLNVPQPTEVHVGDVVEGTSHSGAIGPVLEFRHDGEENFVIYRNDTNRRCPDKCWSGVTRVIIRDDTREGVAA